ncbi:hypothetical protein J2772_000834 [Chryseobacterium jejuense]|nr:hypothetical protein [Chryseobacterium jejuense]
MKTIYTVSDVDVVESSHYDMLFKYFFGNGSGRGGYQFNFTHKIHKITVERHGSAQCIDC